MKLNNIILFFTLLFVSNALVAQQNLLVPKVNYDFGLDIDLAVEETYTSVTNYTQTIFENAIDRVPFFVDKIYADRDDQLLWEKEFNRLVLSQKAIDELFKKLGPLYKKDLKKLIRFMCDQSLKMAIAKIKKIKYDSRPDIKSLQKSLPDAKTISAKIYLDLEKEGANKLSKLEKVSRVVNKLDTKDKLAGLGSLIIISILVSNPLPLIAGTGVYASAKFYEGASKAEYKVDMINIVRKHRDLFLNTLKNGYRDLLLDVRKRIKNQIDEILKKNGVGDVYNE